MRYMVTDIETTPLEEKYDVFDKFNRDKFLLDDYWLKRNLGEARTEEETYKKWRVYKTSTSMEYCQVVGLNWVVMDGNVAIDGPTSMWVGELLPKEDGKETHVIVSEKLLLRKFWQVIATEGDRKGTFAPVVTFNGASFDLSVARYRSAVLGVKPSRDLSDVKPWATDYIDEFAKLYPTAGNKKGMKELRACLVADGAITIPAKYAEIMAMDGGEVFDLYQKKDFATLKLYGELDVFSEAGIYRVFKGLWW